MSDRHQGARVSVLLNPKGPCRYMGGYQKYGPFLGPCYNTGTNTGPNLGDPKRDHNFDNPPYGIYLGLKVGIWEPLWVLSIWYIHLHGPFGERNRVGI